MASSSSSLTSSTKKSFKYDVFISFRGTDTCKNFVDHLYEAFKQHDISTYKDDKILMKGLAITDPLINIIEDSRSYIIVFSKNYASSSWCLNELVKIMECHKKNDQTVYTVCYDVEAEEVRKQSGAVGEAFARYNNNEETGKWRQALEIAANLPGWELKDTFDGHEAEFIKKTVQKISLELRPIYFGIDEKLVGMENRIDSFMSLLETNLDDVRLIGIKGVGGSGKTTLARAIFDRISINFEARSFVEKVREVSRTPGELVRKMLRTKLLLVMDDVDHKDQLKAMSFEIHLSKPGSIIIITTRDAQLLKLYNVHWIYDVKLLSDEESLCLFSRHAFGRDLPVEGYKELSLQVVNYAVGLPLTVRVLGSFLCGKDKSEWIDSVERLKRIPLNATLEKLEISYTGLEDYYKEIFLDVACLLKGWDKERASRMLESRGFPARNGLRVLEQKSMIITTNTYQAEFIDMHPHIEEMGKNIVRRLYPDEPSRHSRLWHQEEIEDILANKLGSKTIEAIVVDSPVKRCSEIATKGFGSMKNLRLLCVKSVTDGKWDVMNYDCDVKNDEFVLTFPSSLRFLSWFGYPYWSLPKTFLAYNLVVLELPYSRIKRLWEGGEGQVFHKLKYIDLSHSNLSTHDLGLTPNLETLNLSECHDLVELHVSIGCLKLRSIKVSHSKLMTLDLRLTPNLEVLEIKECLDLVELHMPVECQNLTSVDLNNLKLRTFKLCMAPNLEGLNIDECHDLVELDMPVECLKLMSLELRHSKLRTLDLGLTPNLETLSLKECHDLEELHMPVRCPKLKSVELSHSKLSTFDLRLTPNLEHLTLRECHDLVELHMSIGCLKKLWSIKVSHLKLMTLDLRLTPNLEVLEIKECHDLVELHMPVECLNLTSLDLNHLKLRTFKLSLAPNLEELKIVECHDLVELDMPVECLKLMSLELRRSKLRTFDLGLTPNLEQLTLEECDDLVELIMMVETPNLRSLKVGNSKLRSLDLVLTPKLELLDLQDCNHLAELHMPTGGLKRLICLNLSGCSKIKSFLFIEQLESLKVLSLNRLYIKEFPDMIIPRHLDSSLLEFRFRSNDIYELPSSIGNLQQLVYLDLHSCRKLKVLPGSICSLRNLRNLKLYGCSLEELPEDIGRLECLEKLNLSFTSIKHLPDSICMLKNLKTLNLSSCWNLENLPEDIGRLSCLETLILKECTQVRGVPDSIFMLKELKYLSFLDCIQLQKLPNELGRLKRLEELNINGTRIRFLPSSISLLTELKICGPKSGIWGIKWNESASQIKDSEASKAEGEHQFKKQRTS